MDYEIFDTSAILLGLLAAVLAAECIILFIKTQAMKGRLDSTVESAVKEERAKFESRRSELELELRERAMRLETEYGSLVSEAEKARRRLADERAHVAQKSAELKLEIDAAANERRLYEKKSAEAQARGELFEIFGRSSRHGN